MINQKELQMGIAIEMEHTKDKRLAEKLAMDHLRENPRYYSELQAAGLEECGAIAVVSIEGENENGEAAPSKPLTSSNLGSGTPKPLTSDTLQAPEGKNSVPTLGKTPPKMPTQKNQMFADSIADEEGNAKTNSVRVEKTPQMNGCCDATQFFGGQIEKALTPETPRRMEVIPANIYERKK